MDMGMNHFDALGIENILDVQHDRIAHIPVILRLCPYTQVVADGAVTVAVNDRRRCGLQKNPVIGCRLNQRIQHLLRRPAYTAVTVISTRRVPVEE